jgi:hypothetical protein
MKIRNPGSVGATFVSAVLSLILPASALPADDALRSHDSPPPVQAPRDERVWTDPLRNDPILDSKWGPGDPTLTARQFHIPLSPRVDDKPSIHDRSDAGVDRDPADPGQGSAESPGK